MRFVYATKTYYADLDASTDGYQSAEAAQLTTFAEVLPSANGVNWCNVQWPLTTTAAPGAQTDLIFGQVWIPGVTDHAGSDGRVAAQLGFGAGGSDPRTAQWTWLPATWNADSGSNDEYKASFTAPATAGTYRYVYRMRLLSGWTYCNTDPGVNDAHPFDPAKAGTLTVQ
jgi:hypothetical protein